MGASFSVNLVIRKVANSLQAKSGAVGVDAYFNINFGFNSDEGPSISYVTQIS